MIHLVQVYKIAAWIRDEVNTDVKKKATRAQMTTVASSMFHKSRQYEPGWKITPRLMICCVYTHTYDIATHSLHTTTAAKTAECDK